MKQIRKIIGILLGMIMIAGLAGCGKGSEETAVAKDFYYVPSYHELPIEADYIQSTVACQDSIYLLASTWNQETGENKSMMYCYAPLTGEMQEFPLMLAMGDSVQQMAVNASGNLLLLVQKYQMISPDGEIIDAAEAEKYGDSIEYRAWMELWEVSAQNAEILQVTDLTSALESEEDFWVQCMALDSQDNLYISDGNTQLYVLNAKGNKIFGKQTEGWINGLFTGNDGKVYINSYGEVGSEIHAVDLQQKLIGEALKSEGLNSGNAYNQRFYIGEGNTLLVNDSSSVFTYALGTDIKTELFQWLDADINSDNVREMGQLSDGRYWALLCDYSNEKNEYSFVTVTKTPASEVAVKEELVYGTMWLDQGIRKNIIDFNKSNEKYRITVKEYGNTDYETGIMQLNNDITGGNCPDMIDISSVNFKLYAEKGVFENLYPYIEQSGFNKADYLENIFKAYEINGELYAIVPQFYITTTAAKASKVGDVSGWTLQEMLAFVKDSDAENIFPYATRDTVFGYCIYNNIDEFIDGETGTCNFNGEEFIQILEFANDFPQEWDYSKMEEGTYSKIKNDKLLLLQTSISSVQEYQMMNGMFDNDIAFVGYPNSERKGNLIQPANGSIAVSAKSKDKDGAWEFVKTFISEEYQNQLVGERTSGWGFPISLTALEKKFEKDMTPEYYEDENGNKVEQMKTSWGYDDFNMDIYAAKQEDIDAVKEIIASAQRTHSEIGEELTNIINEEAAAFFKGQKSAKETAEIIQNRVQIYVNENR